MVSANKDRLDNRAIVRKLLPHLGCYDGLQYLGHSSTVRCSMDSRRSIVVRHITVRFMVDFFSHSNPLCRHSDATKDRFWHIAVPIFIGITGFAIGMLTMNTAARYLSL